MSAAPDSVASPAAREHLHLALVSGIGPIRFMRLLRAFGDVAGVLRASMAALSRVEGIGPELAQRIAAARDDGPVERELALAHEHLVRVVCLADGDYPPALRRITDPPPVLYVRGTLEAADAVALGVVGSRHCTRYGAEQAERFSALAARAGLTVVSGLARGIDQAAHRGALAGGGRTLAVLGCGMCHLYPPEARELAEQIVQAGALLSEFPMEVAADEGNFPRRNRIIAGLSLGVLVVEAAERSGALITARLANDYNREVFAVPGRLDAPQSAGCNRLIQRGEAKLVTELRDVLEELGDAGRALLPESPAPARAAADASLPADLEPDERTLLMALTGEALSIDAVVDETGLPAARVAALLTSLQLAGLVKRVGDDSFARAAPRGGPA
ncbi:MAG: DNA-processing protein DprA [Phycisphaerae bacterium]